MIFECKSVSAAGYGHPAYDYKWSVSDWKVKWLWPKAQVKEVLQNPNIRSLKPQTQKSVAFQFRQNGKKLLKPANVFASKSKASWFSFTLTMRCVNVLRTKAGLWRHLLLTGYVTLPFSIWALFFHGNLSRIAEVMPPKQHRNKSTIILDANLDPSRLWMKIHLCHTCASCWLLMLALFRISFAIIILAKNLWRFWKSTTVPLIQWNEITKLWL